MSKDKVNGTTVPTQQDEQAIIAELLENQSPRSDAGTASIEQQAIVDAIAKDSVCVEITTASVLGAVLVAFNQTAKKHNRVEQSPQQWAELAITTGLLAIKRTWEYSAKTRNNAAFVAEMRTIATLFTVPTPDHAKYREKMFARFEAEQACRVKYGVQ